MIIALSEMYQGECAELLSLPAAGEVGKRLKSMGMREGRLVELLHYDPLVAKKVVVALDQARIAFPVELASGVRVRPLKSYFETIKVQAHYDNLTGCCNRHVAGGIIREELEKFSGKGIPFSLLIADLDHFKRINDNYGHQAGDDVLKGFATVARRGLRRCDVLARWGGEEFLILLRGTVVEEAKQIAERLRHMVESAVFPPFEREGLVTVSIGGCGMPPGRDFESLFAQADSALYLSKNNGRNRVTVC
ncbi:MAG: diguanylate cyclase [Geobacter sp.]|nr:MAG: diguanylate cyclase [Geobacter sp.]